MQWYCDSLTEYKRLKTLEVNIGGLLLGNFHPIRVQTMTTTDTMDTNATVEQSIRCIEAGAELVRITAPSKFEAENLLNIKNELRKRGYNTPLVADIHFTPNAAEIAARIVEKVRINPGNYIDKKKFEFIEYTDAEYNGEIERIRQRFTPLVKICKEYGTAMRIGTNHGSLSDRIMSRYGDTPMGMVESAMEFLRIARDESYHNIVLSMKSSNPLVMVEAYRLLVHTMMNEFRECYPLHLGVTEAGDGEDGRIKSAIGIGSLMEDGIGDTIRVSLTEDPEFEIPVCKDLVNRYVNRAEKMEAVIKSGRKKKLSPILPGNPENIWNTEVEEKVYHEIPALEENHEDPLLPYSPFNYLRRETTTVENIGARHVPVVVADLIDENEIKPEDLKVVGYTYDEFTDKWNISDAAADFIFSGDKLIQFDLPGTLKVLCSYNTWLTAGDDEKYFPVFQLHEYILSTRKSSRFNALLFDTNSDNLAWESVLHAGAHDPHLLICLESTHHHAMPSVRRFMIEMMKRKLSNPVVLCVESIGETVDEQLIHFATDAGALLLDGFGDGIWLWSHMKNADQIKMSGRTYLEVKNVHQFLNNTSFSILQATRTRISKTEYISCPSCGRTLFDLQETTAKIRAVTHHLKGVKIAIMGCIVNGPGEMADADFGYVGSGQGKITLYRGKEVVKRSVDSNIAVEELINLLKESDAWIEPDEKR
ncbi:MAG: 4-hydroxy-3-methylbut-2-en-1-yl diphosphate synthase [Bacteroidetes bacterium]|nr:MAG: 4-hydroxy-3-methylbut-2-en-1-yl diphosphate synthase [Bacteroidota bacterium]